VPEKPSGGELPLFFNIDVFGFDDLDVVPDRLDDEPVVL